MLNSRVFTAPEREESAPERARTFPERLAISFVFCPTVHEKVFTVVTIGARVAAKIIT